MKKNTLFQLVNIAKKTGYDNELLNVISKISDSNDLDQREFDAIEYLFQKLTEN